MFEPYAKISALIVQPLPVRPLPPSLIIFYDAILGIIKCIIDALNSIIKLTYDAL